MEERGSSLRRDTVFRILGLGLAVLLLAACGRAAGASRSEGKVLILSSQPGLLTATNAVLRPVSDKVPLGRYATGMSVAPGGRTVYVAGRQSARVSLGQATRVSALGEVPPSLVAFSEDPGFALWLGLRPPVAIVLDLRTGAVDRVALKRACEGSPDGSVLQPVTGLLVSESLQFVATNTGCVLPIENGAPMHPIQVGGPQGPMAFSARTDRLYVAGLSPELSVIDPRRLTVVRTIQLASPASDVVYVPAVHAVVAAEPLAGVVEIISSTPGANLRGVRVGRFPTELVPGTGADVYALGATGELAEISLPAGRVIKSMSLGRGQFSGLVVNPRTATGYMLQTRPGGGGDAVVAVDLTSWRVIGRLKERRGFLIEVALAG